MNRGARVIEGVEGQIELARLFRTSNKGDNRERIRGQVSHASIGVRITVNHVTMRDSTLCLLV